jgi:hypothetical protein
MPRLVLRFGALHHRRDGDEGRGEARLDARRPARQRRDAELREAPHRAAQPLTKPVSARLDPCATAAEPGDVELPAAVARQPEVLRGGPARRGDARRFHHSCALLLLPRFLLLPLLCSALYPL